jgi:hypothetical protein
MCAMLARFCEHLNFYFFTMANKRELKKAIKMACGEIAGQCLMAESSLKDADIDKWDNIIVNAAMLQKEAVTRVSVEFDKTPKDFESKSAYNAARKAYFKGMEKSIADYMHTEVAKIVEAMNALLPKEK